MILRRPRGSSPGGCLAPPSNSTGRRSPAFTSISSTSCWTPAPVDAQSRARPGPFEVVQGWGEIRPFVEPGLPGRGVGDHHRLRRSHLIELPGQLHGLPVARHEERDLGRSETRLHRRRAVGRGQQDGTQAARQFQDRTPLVANDGGRPEAPRQIGSAPPLPPLDRPPDRPFRRRSTIAVTTPTAIAPPSPCRDGREARDEEAEVIDPGPSVPEEKQQKTGVQDSTGEDDVRSRRRSPPRFRAAPAAFWRAARSRPGKA